MNSSELKVIADLTVELTRLRQNECKHLSVENCGPEIFAKLVAAYLYGVDEPITLDALGFRRRECHQPGGEIT